MTDQPNFVCPQDEVFVKAFMGELSLKSKDELLAHVLTCPHCRLKFQTLKQVRNELRKTEEPTKETRFPWRISLKLAGAAAGMILLLLSGVFILSKYNRGGMSRGWDNGKLHLIEPHGIIPEAPSIFKWTSVKNTDSYMFSLIDDELHTIATLSTRKPSIELPNNILANLVKGKTYVWTVEARDDDDMKLGSASKSFEIR